ncbi:MAG: cation:proton antiporter [Candidatus Aenigmatarchaeota archaeon]
MDEIRIILDIAMILIAAKVFGQIAERFKISHIVGEITAGLLIGPILHLIYPGSQEFLSLFSMIGVIVLLFLMGLYTKFDDIKDGIYSGTYIAIVASVVSLASGIGIGFIVFNSFEIGLVIGVVLMGTSSAIPIKMLVDMGELRTRAGRLLVTTSMADDIITLIALAAISTFFTFGVFQIWTIVALIFTVMGFIVVALTVGEKISNKILSVVQRLKDEEVMLVIPLVILFVVAFISQRIGVAAVTGAFLAGMAMSRSVFAEPVIVPKIKAIGYGFFIPIFFAYSALIIDLGLLMENLWILLILVVVGLVLKSVSSGWMAGLFGMRGREKLIMAFGMMPRGEYGIVVAQVALGLGVIAVSLYGILIAFVAISVVITPIFFRIFIRR